MVKAHSHLKLLPASILVIWKVFKHIGILFWGIQKQPKTVIPTLLVSDFGILGHLWSQNDVSMSWLRLTANSNYFLHPHHTYTKCLSTLICCPCSYGSIKQLYPPYLAHTSWFWVTCGVKKMSLCHCWGWQPTWTTLCIQIIHIQSVWAHWYAVHGYMVVASNSYTRLTWLIFCGSGSLVESKWCHYVMVDADSHLKMLPVSTSYLYKVFEHIDMLSMGIWQ